MNGKKPWLYCLNFDNAKVSDLNRMLIICSQHFDDIVIGDRWDYIIDNLSFTKESGWVAGYARVYFNNQDDVVLCKLIYTIEQP